MFSEQLGRPPVELLSTMSTYQQTYLLNVLDGLESGANRLNKVCYTELIEILQSATSRGANEAHDLAVKALETPEGLRRLWSETVAYVKDEDGARKRLTAVKRLASVARELMSVDLDYGKATGDVFHDAAGIIISVVDERRRIERLALIQDMKPVMDKAQVPSGPAPRRRDRAV
jgi:hypothetical protein